MSVIALVGAFATTFAATFTVNSTADLGDGSCDAANCTFREAINAANGAAGVDTIIFNILPAGPKTIVLNGGVQVQNSAAIIDATTQPGWAGVPIIELNGNGSGGDGIAILAGNSTVRGLVINRFTGNGIAMQNTGGNTITGNYIGTNAAGTAALGNGQSGILISGSPANAIGGTVAVDRNIISGNTVHGIAIQNGNTAGNLIKGNYIGVDVTGTLDLGNGSRGVSIDSAPFGIVGGGEPGARNIISGNDNSGVVIFNSSATQNRVQGNYIGTDVTGAVAIPNTAGILLGDQALLRGSSNDFIGTDGDGVNDATEGNLVSGNTQNGIVLSSGGTSANVVAGNRVGVNADGTAALPNGVNGILLIEGPSGNFVGTNGDGTSDAEERNVVSGNLESGIAITGTGSNANRVSGNFIGTTAAGTGAIPNGAGGVRIEGDISNSTIGTNLDGVSDTLEGNIISGNQGAGISIVGANATGNRILGNSIFSNTGLGIDLGADGVTTNDTGDIDSGPNRLQNNPLIVRAFSGSTVVVFAFNSFAAEQFRIELFASAVPDPSGFGEGQTFLGSTVVTTDGSGNVLASFNTPTTTPPGQFVAATATRLATGDTSEFSNARVVVPITAAHVAVAGRVLTSDGRPIAGTRVVIVNQSGDERSTITSPFGWYRFDDIPSGQSYLLQASHKRYTFEPRFLSVVDEVLDADIIAEPEGKEGRHIREKQR